jgi:hypothetical protein
LANAKSKSKSHRRMHIQGLEIGIPYTYGSLRRRTASHPGRLEVKFLTALVIFYTDQSGTARTSDLWHRSGNPGWPAAEPHGARRAYSMEYGACRQNAAVSSRDRRRESVQQRPACARQGIPAWFFSVRSAKYPCSNNLFSGFRGAFECICLAKYCRWQIQSRRAG